MSRIVVDTNVFVQSCNPENNHFDDAVDFIIKLKDSSFVLYLDKGFDVNESKNSSRIWSEYIQHIPRESLATDMLSELFINRRIDEVDPRVSININKILNQEVVDKSDRVFVKVAHNSKSKSLVSHDSVAFPKKVRNKLRRLEIANVISCEEEDF